MAGHGVYGVGALPCSQFNYDAKNQNDDYYQKMHWSLGYLSAAGYHGRKFDRINTPSLSEWLIDFCKTNPNHSLDQGLNKYLYLIEK